MTVNARAEEDVEPEAIMQKVAKASGANYSFHKESNRFRDSGPQGPVVSSPAPRISLFTHLDATENLMSCRHVSVFKCLCSVVCKFVCHSFMFAVI